LAAAVAVKLIQYDHPWEIVWGVLGISLFPVLVLMLVIPRYVAAPMQLRIVSEVAYVRFRNPRFTDLLRSLYQAPDWSPPPNE
jgi:hypothetical protein